MKNYVIKTITKSQFNKLPKWKKRVVVAQDVIDRIKLGQLVPENGEFVNRRQITDQTVQISEKLKLPKFSCEVCAKGGLFMAYIGIENGIRFNDMKGGPNTNGENMKKLSKIFPKKQLNQIEMAFEGFVCPGDGLSVIERRKLDSSKNYYNNLCNRYDEKTVTENHNQKYNFPKFALISICKNIIKNNGEFKP